MSGTPLTLTLAEHRSGTSWENGFRVRVIEAETETVVGLEGATASLVWSTQDGTALQTWTIGSGLEVLDPATGWLWIVGPDGAIGDPDDPMTMTAGVLVAPESIMRGELVITFGDGTTSEPIEVVCRVSKGAALP